jgi:hypothetical protein
MDLIRKVKPCFSATVRNDGANRRFCSQSYESQPYERT